VSKIDVEVSGGYGGEASSWAVGALTKAIDPGDELNTKSFAESLGRTSPPNRPQTS
jgi:hypothetical protein